MVQVALAWLLAKKAVTSVILGAAKLHQLEGNLGAVDVKLTEQELAALDAATASRRLYPNWFIDNLRRPPRRGGAALDARLEVHVSDVKRTDVPKHDNQLVPGDGVEAAAPVGDVLLLPPRPVFANGSPHDAVHVQPCELALAIDGVVAKDADVEIRRAARAPPSRRQPRNRAVAGRCGFRPRRGSASRSRSGRRGRCDRAACSERCAGRSSPAPARPAKPPRKVGRDRPGGPMTALIARWNSP